MYSDKAELEPYFVFLVGCDTMTRKRVHLCRVAGNAVIPRQVTPRNSVV